MAEIEAFLHRLNTSDQGTLGILQIGEIAFCKTIELPWRDNKQKISCIPEGRYLVKWVKSPKYGWIYQVQGVPNRGSILTHWGNLAGDKSKGYLSHSEGCIILGRSFGVLDKQKAVLYSLPIVRQFNALMNKQDFYLTISKEY